MQSFRTRVIGLGASALVSGTLAVGVLAPSASAASPSVVTVVKTQEKRVAPKLSILDHISLSKPSDARRYVPKLSALATAFDRAATAVADATATTSAQKAGQTEWVSAARGTAKGLSQLAGAFKDIASGNTTAAGRLLKTAKSTVAKATKLGKKADKLLGINPGS